MTSENEYEGVIHRNITENKKGTIWYTLDKVVEECPYHTFLVQMEECENDEDYYNNEKKMREKSKMKQQRNMKEVARMFLQLKQNKLVQDQGQIIQMKKMIRLVNLMLPLVQVTGFMIFFIKRKKS